MWVSGLSWLYPKKDELPSNSVRDVCWPGGRNPEPPAPVTAVAFRILHGSSSQP
jgi:hypothetical protein